MIGLTVDHAERLSQHPNFRLRRYVAPVLFRMATQHASEQYDPVRDRDACKLILYFADASEIRAALVPDS